MSVLFLIQHTPTDGVLLYSCDLTGLVVPRMPVFLWHRFHRHSCRHSHFGNTPNLLAALVCLIMFDGSCHALRLNDGLITKLNDGENQKSVQKTERFFWNIIRQ